MTTSILVLCLNFAATAALWNEIRIALEQSWRTALIYGLGIMTWWGSAIWSAMEIGAYLERTAI